MLDRALAIFREAWRALAKHPLRSFLSALTCAVAIAVTVNVISLTFGLDADMRQDVSKFGRRTIDIGRLPVFGVKEAPAVIDGDALDRLRTSLADLNPVLVPRVQQSAMMEVRGVNRPDQDDGPPAQHSFVAVPTSYQSTLDVAMLWGRWFRDEESDACVLDRSLAETLGVVPEGAESFSLDGAPRVLQVKLDGATTSYRIVGILADPMTYRAMVEEFDWGRGARSLSSSLLSFRNAYVASMSGDHSAVSAVSIVFPDDASVAEAAKRVREIYPATFENIFEMISRGDRIGHFVRAEWMDALGATSQQGLLIGNMVWVIIVLVAAIMIATLNMVGIRERYNELAIRRVEGARRRDVATQVMWENVLTSLAGGLMGLPLGFAGAAVLSHIVGFPFRFIPIYGVFATLIAIVLGLVASVWPARHAASLDPARILSRRLR